jgi:6-phosphofructokinase 1
MNAAIYQAWITCRVRGIPIVGVHRGFRGLREGEFQTLHERELGLAQRLAGTVLGTSRLPSFSDHVCDLLAVCRRHELDGLMVIGGHGSLRAAAQLATHGLRVVGLPATIDNDIAGCDETIGFDSALSAGVAALDGVRATAESMPRVFGVETLGGDTGYLACAVAAAGFADLTLVPEHPSPLATIEDRLRVQLERSGSAIVVGGEGYVDLQEILEGCATRAGSELRYTKLGHAQRGATPSARDRRLARVLAGEAVLALEAGVSGAVVVRCGRAERVPFDQVTADKPPPVPVTGGIDDDGVQGRDAA